MGKRFAWATRLRRLNPVILASEIGLGLIGVLFIHSACAVRGDPALQMQGLQHLAVGAAGLALSAAVALLNYRRLMPWSWLFYLACLALLALVPFIGEARMGGRRWLFGFQPSEPAKIAIILMLARLFGRRGAKRGAGAFLAGAALVAAPAALILLQPDLGTAMVLVPTFFAMLFAARVAPRIVWSCALAGLIAVAALLGAVSAVEKNPSLTPAQKIERLQTLTRLRPHQIRRIQVFLFPDKDLHGSGYNRRQSEIAVGSGGRWGKGYQQGVQYTLGYLPPSVSSNDFIFAVLAEEAGFAGSLTVLLLYLCLLWAGLRVAWKCQDDMGRLFCIGLVTLVFSHAFINIAMTIGMMPITGLPLPFISYGRTFMLTLLSAFGLVQSVSIYGREPETRF